MRVVLLGAMGLQGKAALVDLCRSKSVTSVVCADMSAVEIPDELRFFVDLSKVERVSMDARNIEEIKQLFGKRSMSQLTCCPRS